MSSVGGRETWDGLRRAAAQNLLGRAGRRRAGSRPPKGTLAAAWDDLSLAVADLLEAVAHAIHRDPFSLK